MSPFQTAREIGGGIIEGLKSQPMILALIVMNIAFLGFALYEGISERETSRTLTAEILRGANVERDRWKDLVESAMKWCPAGSYPPAPKTQ